MKLMAEAAEAPFANSERPIETAAYEHDDEAAPRPVAFRIGATPLPLRPRRIVS